MIRAKKHLGQHFLKDENIARKIVASLSKNGYNKVLEIGAGMGMLTKFLIREKSFETFIVEIDSESVSFLKKTFPELKNKITEGDFLKIDFNTLTFGEGRSDDSGESEYRTPSEVGLIGNFPYNISSQILFKVFENRNQFPEVVGMFQKEVAERIASKPNSKKYGILSVLMQAFYDIEYLFTVNENVFIPPPKVKSAVIRLTRNNIAKLDCNEELFKTVVKTGFNQRRKTLRNALSSLIKTKTGRVGFTHPLLTLRAEQLSVNNFVELTKIMEMIHPKHEIRTRHLKK